RAPAVVSRLVAQVEARTRRELLDARTTLVHGERRFMPGDRYKDLPRKLAKKVRRAFEGYAASLDEADRPDAESLAVVDCALRIAGTGSLGGVRVAVLVRGKGGDDGG